MWNPNVNAAATSPWLGRSAAEERIAIAPSVPLQSAPLRAVIVGEGSLPLRCAAWLNEQGQPPVAIASGDTALLDWARAHQIPCHRPQNSEDLTDFLRQFDFDYLFSIVNSLILKTDVLALPHQGAINYHDSLLPRYGGLNAAAWAIIHQETCHGISWHWMTEGIDDGEILRQRAIPLQGQETALTLNAQCYETALDEFEQLVAQLQAGTAISQAQDLSQSSYFASYARPWAAGVLDFQQSAAQLSALVRGLAFGPGYANPLTLPKLWLGDRLWVVSQLEPQGQVSRLKPGQVIGCPVGQLVVATATEDVALSGLMDLDGIPIAAPALEELLQRLPSSRLPLPSAKQAQQWQSQTEAIARRESFWRRRLLRCSGLKLPLLGARPGEAGETAVNEAKTPALSEVAEPALAEWSLTLPAAVLDWLRKGDARSRSPLGREAREALGFGTALQRGVTAAWTAYLNRLGEGDLAEKDGAESDVDIWLDEAVELPGGSAEDPTTDLPAGLLSQFVPLRAKWNLAQPFGVALQALDAELEHIGRCPTYGTDLWLREPVLRQRLAETGQKTLPLAVIWCAELSDGVGSSPQPPQGYGPSRARHQLSLVLPRRGDRLVWRYDPQQVSGARVRRLSTLFLNFLTALAAPEGQNLPLAQQPLMPAAEREQVLSQWNQTQANEGWDWNCCIHELFEQQVARTPTAIALVHGQEHLTYAQLNAWANRIAHGLRDRGVGPEDRVGVHVERSPEMIAALLGVLKAGAAYVPMDPTYPRDRLIWMLTDAQPKVLLTQIHLQEQLPHPLAMCLDSSETFAQTASTNPLPLARPDNLAYIIYTSGSTGRPKGVMVEHRNLSNFAQAAIADYGIEPSDRVLQFASISFDAAAEEIYPALISGCQLFLRSSDMMGSVGQFLETCQDYGLTVLDLPTAYWHLLVAELSDDSLALPSQLRIVIIGGEAVNPKRIQQWQTILKKRNLRIQLINTYGPTETTVVSTAYKLPLPPAELPPPSPIGYPIANVTNYVLDRNQQPLPWGCLGELWVGGAGVARGYLNRPELTAERFRADPFAAEPGRRLYRTGDLVRQRADGAIDYLGRLDHQIKIRGFRIELGEIEALLCQQPSVAQAVVVVREDQPGQKRLVAYGVAKAGADWLPEQLRQALARQLPDYMVPCAFVCLPALPLTPNEKLDRKALPVPDWQHLTGGDRQASGFLAPRTAVERTLAELWEQLLGIAPIGRNDHFLELGGDSLMAMRLCLQIEKTFGKKLLLSSLFQSPRLDQLAKVIEGERLKQQNCLIQLQVGSDRPPLFFINCAHDANQIAQYLGEEYPIYGLNLFGATERLHPQLDQMTLQSLAEVFVEDIRQVQPQGPYYLSSYCGDTRMAVALAQEFQRQNDEVALLALIDPWWNEKPLTWAYHWHSLRYFGPDYGWSKGKDRLRLVRKTLLVKFDQGRAWLRQLSRQSPSAVDRDVALYQQYRSLCAAYQPQPYAGHTLLLLSEELKQNGTGELIEVKAAFQDYELRSVPGYHHALFYPESLPIIGHHLGEAIDAARQRMAAMARATMGSTR